LVAALCCGALMFERIRPHAAALLCGVSLVWCAWGVNVYMVKTAPHWGQRETIAAYYLDRASSKQQLVAYQMNWKGENFYTGNRIAAFVQTGKKFKEWLDQQRKKGVRVLYFTTEHSRVG
jgi:hypothetical protein